MNIKQAAEVSGLAADTIRFYERRRVLPRPPRQGNGYREYTDRHVTTLQFARGLRELGLPLDDLAAVLHVAHDGTCGDLRDSLISTVAEARAETEARLRELRRTRHRLRDLAAGLAGMTPTSERVPGLESCECFMLVEDKPRGRAPASTTART